MPALPADDEHSSGLTPGVPLALPLRLFPPPRSRYLFRQIVNFKKLNQDAALDDEANEAEQAGAAGGAGAAGQGKGESTGELWRPGGLGASGGAGSVPIGGRIASLGSAGTHANAADPWAAKGVGGVGGSGRLGAVGGAGGAGGAGGLGKLGGAQEEKASSWGDEEVPMPQQVRERGGELAL